MPTGVLAFGALISLSGDPVPRDAVARLRGSFRGLPGTHVAHGRPDAAFFAVGDPRVAAPADCVPLVHGNLVITGSLRIDARDALCRALAPDDPAALGHAADARLVALAYERWNDACAAHLLGDYAFVIWDRARGRVTSARDAHGNRPLYWACLGNLLAVGSSADVVRAHPSVSGALDDRAVRGFLAEGWPADAERTVLRDVRRVPPAHTLAVHAHGTPQLRRHWHFPLPSPLRYARAEDYVDHFRDVLGAAVRDRLRAPACLYLSGGLDSTMLAATARAVAPSLPLHALTVSYPEVAPSDDDSLSRLAADWLSLPHDVLDGDALPSLGWLAEPEARSAHGPLPVDEPDLAVFRAGAARAAARAPIALYGEDGDTLLHAPTLLHQLRSLPFVDVLGAWSSYGIARGELPWVGLNWRRRVRGWIGGESAAVSRQAALTPWMRHRADPLAELFEPTSAREARAAREHPLRPEAVRGLSSPQWEAVYAVLSPPVSRASVLFTLPLVDPRVLAFVFAIPPVPWCQRKQLFRAAMDGRLPPAVLRRPKTPLRGYHEARVAAWRRAGGAEVRLTPALGAWVDVPRLRDTLRTGTVDQVLEAWRAVQFDHWLALH